MNEEHDSLNNLPGVSKAAGLEERSIKAFQARLSEERFGIRDQSKSDFGVDLTLEARFNGKATNYQANVQLKGRSSLRALKDGSYSVPIKISNINYLLSGAFALYVLYIEQENGARNELRFVFVWELFNLLQVAKPDWQKKSGTINIRFINVLDSTSIEEAWKKIIQHGISGRTIKERVYSSNTPSTVVSIKSDTFEVEDPKEIKEFPLKKGVAQTIAGMGSEVLEKFNLLSKEDKKQPSMQLLHGIIQFEMHEFQRAKEVLSLLLNHAEQLTSDDKLLANFVIAYCNFETGVIDHQTLVSKIKGLAEIKPKVSYYDFQITHLKLQLDAETDVIKRRQLVGEMKTYALANTNKESRNKADFRNLALALEQEGNLLALEFTLGITEVLCNLNTPALLDILLVAHNEKLNRWKEEFIGLILLANNELITADAYCVIAIGLIMHKSALILLSKYRPDVTLSFGGAVESMKSFLRSVIETYSQHDLTNQRLRAEVLLAGLLSFDGPNAESDEIFARASEQAQDFNYSNIQKSAHEPLISAIRHRIYSDG